MLRTIPTRFCRYFAICLVTLILAVHGQTACAQNGAATVAATADNNRIDEQQQFVAGLVDKINVIEKEIAANDENDAGLMQLRSDLETIDRELRDSGAAFRPRLDEINARLDQLGPAPAKGQPEEPEVVARERQSLMSKKAQINTLLGQAEDLSAHVDQLVGNIADMRRELFKSLLTRRYDINFALFGEVASIASRESVTFYQSVSSWFLSTVENKWPSLATATFLALVAAALLVFGGRRLFGNLLEAHPQEEPSWLSRLSVAFWSTLVPTMAVAAFLAVTWFLYDSFGLLDEQIGAILSALFFVIGVVFFVGRLGRAVFSPRLPNWRLVEIDTRSAHLLRWLIFATVLITGLDYFLGRVFEVQRSPLTLIVGESLVATVLVGILVMMIALVQPPASSGLHQRWSKFRRYALFVLGAVTAVSALLGYLGFARFLSTQIVITGAVLATMYIGFLSSRAMLVEDAFINTGFAAWLGRFLKLDETALDQLSVGVSIAINIFIMVAGLPLILILWGFRPGDITAFAYKFATEINIGTLSFSLAGLVTGIIVFGIGFFVTRWFQGWLDGSVMARGRVDGGVRNSIRTTVGYAGIALAGLIGLSAAGIDLSKLALVAGALSLGIGFGLQNVVSNFVSGLILLVERPFKTGDWIVAGSVSGIVRKISVRATEIETFQRQTMILPNSELINSAVGNWTHKNRLGRVDIRVNVAYGSDARRAHEIMLRIATEHPLALKNPEPFVVFLNFGPAALEFEIRLFIADINQQSTVLNDIRFAVLEAFDREKIEIPSTPRAPVEKTTSGEWPLDDDKDDAKLMQYKDEAASKAAAARAKKGRGRSRTIDPDQG